LTDPAVALSVRLQINFAPAAARRVTPIIAPNTRQKPEAQ
jgi:hypothetical protein